MKNTNFDLYIVAVYYQFDFHGDYPEYVLVDTVFYDCDVLRARFYLPYKKFNLKQIKKRCPWVHCNGKRKKVDWELIQQLEDFMLGPEHESESERIVLKEFPPDFENIYYEMRLGYSYLKPYKMLNN